MTAPFYFTQRPAARVEDFYLCPRCHRHWAHCDEYPGQFGHGIRWHNGGERTCDDCAGGSEAEPAE